MPRFELREVPKDQAVGERKWRVWDNEVNRFADRPAVPYSKHIAESLMESLYRLNARNMEVRNG